MLKIIKFPTLFQKNFPNNFHRVKTKNYLTFFPYFLRSNSKSLFSNKISLINDNHVAIAIFYYFDKTKSRDWSSKRAYWCAQPFSNKTIYPYMYFYATFFTQKFFWIRYFLHIITIVYSLLYLVHNFSLSVFLTAKEHHNCKVNTKTHLSISSTILIPFSL